MTKNLADRLKVLHHMLRKAMSKHTLLIHLQLLLRHGKNVGKAIDDLLTFHHHQHHSAGHSYTSSFLCHSMDPDLAVYVPQEIEFNCNSTPDIPSFPATRRRHLHRQHNGHKYDTTVIAKIFEVLNGDILGDCPAILSPSPAVAWHNGHKYDTTVIAKIFEVLNGDILGDCPAILSPSPAVAWSYGKSPVLVRQLRVTDSPFPVKEEEEVVADGRVDREADEFIRRFYEQLQMQEYGR